MQTADWPLFIEELEDLCEAWRLIASGDADVEIVELPEVPQTTPPPELEARARAALEKMAVVRRELAASLREVRDQMLDLRTASQAADQYLKN